MTEEEKDEEKPTKKKINLIYAGLLLHSAGKDITEESVRKLVDATGEKVDDAQIKAFVTALEGVDIDSAIEKAATPTVMQTETKKKEEKEEKTEEEKEKKAEEAAEGLGALFG